MPALNVYLFHRVGSPKLHPSSHLLWIAMTGQPSRRYLLEPGRELEEIETWSQRTRNTIRWETKQLGGVWEARLFSESPSLGLYLFNSWNWLKKIQLCVVNGWCVPNIVGMGRNLSAAKKDATIKINNSDPPILVSVNFLIFTFYFYSLQTVSVCNRQNRDQDLSEKYNTIWPSLYCVWPL